MSPSSCPRLHITREILQPFKKNNSKKRNEVHVVIKKFRKVVFQNSRAHDIDLCSKECKVVYFQFYLMHVLTYNVTTLILGIIIKN